MSKVYAGDIGTVILLDAGVTLTGGTVAIKWQNPAGNTGTWSGTIATATSGANKGISYTTQAGDVDIAGEWKLQAHAVLPAGTWRGETALMTVYPTFE
jgi:hypothetical protein